MVFYDCEGNKAEASPLTRRNLSYVPQGNTLFSGTIRDNLRMGNPDAGDEEYSRALHLAAADFVMDLPDGLDTRCGEHGVGLSEGPPLPEDCSVQAESSCLTNRPRPWT